MGDHITTIEIHGKERYGADPIACTREALHNVLTNALKKEGIEINYGKKLKELKQDNDRVTAIFEDGSQATGALLVGCDGLHSRTRELIFPHAPQPEYVGLDSYIAFTSMDQMPKGMTTPNIEDMQLTLGQVGFFGLEYASSSILLPFLIVLCFIQSLLYFLLR